MSRIFVASPGLELLDVGTGTGVAALESEAAGCRVLGVEVDEAMAGFARRRGLELELARFEERDPAGGYVDAVVAGQAWHWVDAVAAGQAWHWVDSVAGTAKVAEVMRRGGCRACSGTTFSCLPTSRRRSRPHRQVAPCLVLRGALTATTA